MHAGCTACTSVARFFLLTNKGGRSWSVASVSPALAARSTHLLRRGSAQARLRGTGHPASCKRPLLLVGSLLLLLLLLQKADASNLATTGRRDCLQEEEGPALS